MRHALLPALSLATLLACAHDQSKNQVNEPRTAQRAEAEAEVEGERAETAARRTGDERVDLPRRNERGHLASADDDLPGAREKRAAGDEGATEEVGSFDQGNNEIDLDLTQRIRKAVMADDALSFKAKNVKIITNNGRVTLKGTVKSAAEKEAIHKCAVTEAGVGNVSDLIEVDTD